MKKVYTFLILVLVFSKTNAAEFCASCRTIYFTENKGQWHNDVRYKLEMPNVHIFFCQNNFTYLLASEEDLKRLRHDLHRHIEYKPDLDPTVHVHAFRAVFENANMNCKIEGAEKLKEYFNYYLGNDPKHWAAGVNAFHQIDYENIYHGIDLKVYSAYGNMKYDFVVKKNADAQNILIRYEGADRITNENSQLRIKTSVGDVVEMKPYAYQIIKGEKKEVKCAYELNGEKVSFSFPDGYDKNFDLVIDPTLIFSTFSGSTADNFGYSATYDSRGEVYAAGSVFNFAGDFFPTTVGAFQTTWAGGLGYNNASNRSGTGTDIGITKYDSAGTQRIYSTYLGGNHDDLPHSLVVNANDELFVFGTTASNNFPVTPNAYDTSFNGGTNPGVFTGLAVHYLTGSDIIITRFNANGTALLASTYIGGTGNDGLTYPEYAGLHYNYADEVRGEIDVDKNNNVYVATCTRSTNFPTTAGAYQTTSGGLMEGVVVKMDNNLSNLIWSTYIGGSDDDAIYSVTFDGNDDLYVAGGTQSQNFPATAGVIQTTNLGGRADGFIAHLSKNGNQLFEATYYGSSAYDQIYFVETSKAGNVYVLGQTAATGNTFIKNAIYNRPSSGQFISKITPLLDSIIWSTAFGRGDSTPDISPTAFLVDVCNKMYVSGWGSYPLVGAAAEPHLTTAGLDITPDAYQNTTDGKDFYVMVLEDDASALSYATYFGSPNAEEHVDGGTSRFDRKGIMYQSVCAGCGGISSFPTTPGAVSQTNNSYNCNNAVFKFSLDLPLVAADFAAPPTACAPFTAAFTNTSKVVLSPNYQWTFGDGGTSTQFNPSHTYTQPGLYTIQLVVIDPASCNTSDTISKQILIVANHARDTIPAITKCVSQSVQIGLPANPDTSFHYFWNPNNTLSPPNVSNPFTNTTQNTTYQLLMSNGLCTDTFIQKVLNVIDTINASATNILCHGDTIVLSVVSSTGNSFINYTWTPSSLIIAGANTANPLAVPLTNTTFYVTIETAQHCLFTDSVSVTFPAVPPMVNADFIPPPSGCTPYTAQFNNTSSASGTSTYEWHFGDGSTSTLQNPSHTYTQSNLYNVTLIVRDNNACNKIDSVTKQLILLSDTTYSLPAKTICLNDSVQIGFVTNDTVLTYHWQLASTLTNSSISNPVAFPKDTTTYLLIVSNGICSDSIFQTVNVYKDSIDAVGDTVICSGGNIRLLVTHYSSLPLIYDWKPNANILSGDSTNSPTVFASNTTTFIVTAENSLHCRYVDSTVVNVFSSQANVIATANPDTITWGGSSQLYADSSNAIWLMWKADSTLSATDITNPIATPYDNHVYVVEVLDEHGCGKTDSVWVYIIHTPCAESNLYIPNAFSPNNDGKNDVLYVRGNSITKLYFAVYDRWGQKVFETRDIAKGWDGNFKGKKIDPAVFGWYAEGVCESGEKFFKKGNVTLLR